MTYEQKLERENELLRLEVEYLKKLRAFQMNPEDYLEKHKQRYHSNSKKNSN
jgi:transposase